jgi:hypothetical protein
MGVACSGFCGCHVLCLGREMNPLSGIATALGGSGFSPSASSSTGTQGGDRFDQTFGSINAGGGVSSWIAIGGLVLVVLLLLVVMLKK